MVNIIRSTSELIELLSDTRTLLIQSDNTLPDGFNRDLKNACLERAVIFGCSNYFNFIPNKNLIKTLEQDFRVCVYSDIDEGIKDSKQILFHGRSIDDLFLKDKNLDVFFLQNGEHLKCSDKKHFYSNAKNFEIPILPYTHISANDKTEIKKMLKKSPILVQETNNSGGRGNYLIKTEQEILRLPTEKQLIATPYIEDEKIEKNASFFGWIENKNLKIEYIVGQETENLVYSGSSFPVDLTNNDVAQLNHIFDGITSYLVSEKYEGPVGFDLLKSQDTWYALDPNLRLTASFYPYYLGRKFGNASWETVEIDTEKVSQEKVFSKLKNSNQKIIPYFMQDNFFLFLYLGQEDNQMNKENLLKYFNL